MAGAGSMVENLITRVSLQGVETAAGKMRMYGKAHQSAARDMQGAAGMIKGAVMAAGSLGLAAVGVTYLRWAEQGALAAADLSASVDRLGAAFRRAGKGSQQDALTVRESLESIPKVVPAFSSSMMQAAQSMAILGKATPEEVKRSLPVILDTTIALQKMGKEGASLSDVSMKVARGAAGMTRGLKLMLPDIDLTRIKTEGLGYILSELERRFGGAAKEFEKTPAGAIMEYENQVAALQRSMGEGLIPVMVEGVKWFNRGAKAITAFNKETHGAVGIIGLATAGILAIGGAVGTALWSINSLRLAWLSVAGAAGDATVAQEAAATAGVGVGTATVAVRGAAAATGAGAAVGAGAGAAGTAAAAGAGAAAATWFAKGMTGAGAAFGTAVKVIKNLPATVRGIPPAIKGIKLSGAAGAAGRWGAAMKAGWGTAGLAGQLGVGAGTTARIAAMRAAAGTAGVITEITDWILGNTLGRLQAEGPGARIGTGGWLPNISPTRAITEGVKAASDWWTSRGAAVSAREGTRIAEEYVKSGRHTIRERETGAAMPPGDPQLAETNDHLGTLVDLAKQQAKTQIGGSERAGRELTTGDLQRAFARALGKGMA